MKAGDGVHLRQVEVEVGLETAEEEVPFGEQSLYTAGPTTLLR